MQLKRPRRVLGSALLVFACLGSSCRSTEAGQMGPKAAWLQPSVLLEQQLMDEAERLPWTHGIERLEQIRWFAGVGEPGYDLLLELVADERDHVAAAALAALGATGDRRLVPHVQNVKWTEERLEGDLNLERARTLVRLGDWSAMPTLIAGLRDERLYTRGLCAQALREATYLDFGFDPRGSEKARDAGATKWEQWWFKRTGEGLLAN